MKIAHIVCTFPPYRGGMGNSACHFAQEIAKHNHQITVFTPDYGQPICQIVDQPANLEIVRPACVPQVDRPACVPQVDRPACVPQVDRLKPFLKIGSAGFLWQLFFKLKSFDIVHLHYPFYGTAEIVALIKIWRGQKMKLLVHYHMDNQAPGFKGLIFKFYKITFLPLLLNLAEAITCASLDYLKHSNAGSYFKKHSYKFNQTPFGVELKKFTVADKKESGIKNILFVGALDKQHYFKGVDNLLSAAKKLSQNQRLPDWRLIIVGRGDLENHYRQQAQDLEIAERVIFINNADDCCLVDCYQQADMLVLPSINQSEAFGLVLLEAMACGRPVIASNLPGVRSVFRNNEQGWLVKPGDVDDLAYKIKQLLTNEAKAKQMGLAGRQLVERRYTWQKSADKLNEIYYRIKNTPKIKLS